jgi:hypothetical protein
MRSIQLAVSSAVGNLVVPGPFPFWATHVAWLEIGTVAESALANAGLLDRYSLPR